MSRLSLSPGSRGHRCCRALGSGLRLHLHYGDGAAFLGAVGAAELTSHPEALTGLRENLAQSWPLAQVEKYVSALAKDGWPIAHLFRCRSWGTHLAYSDATWRSRRQSGVLRASTVSGVPTVCGRRRRGLPV
ncbi:CbrC family protein [Streptomyces sp. 21So2-11]|uniref:CbrC family protein n=1 Tax=Streptomyces sp. 21So2-11 TaxID=3144408 RepID=UPI00321B060B